MIEVELRSFLTPERFQVLLNYFQKNSEIKGRDEQITYYFDSEQDLRIQKNLNYSKVWLKKGKLHDTAREEIEIKLPREDFEKLEQLFSSLGYNVNIKWLRERHTFEWNNVTVMMDYTKGYGHIIEMEKLCKENEKEEALKLLEQKFTELKIPITPKEEFDTAYQNYKKNWKTLIQ
jgi:predicted adenylyl cyclase CyaB